MRRVLASKEIHTGSPKDIFKKAHAENLIDNAEVWFRFIELRALAAHAYEQENLDAIANSFPLFSHELNKLIENINNLQTI